MVASSVYLLDVLTPHENVSFYITEQAYQHLKKIWTEEPQGSCLRIQIDTGGCSGFQYNFHFEKNETTQDVLFGKEEIRLIVDEASLRFLNKSMLDYEEDMMSAAFIIKNPNAKATCGCGNSFSII